MPVARRVMFFALFDQAQQPALSEQMAFAEFRHAAFMYPNNLSIRTAQPIFTIDGRCFSAKNQMTVVIMNDAIESGRTARKGAGLAENARPSTEPGDMIGIQIPIV